MKNLYLFCLLFGLQVVCRAVTGPISGGSSFCLGISAHLTDTSMGGTWSSSNTGVATIGSLSGLVTGLSAGTSTIYYTTGTGTASLIITINTPPSIFSVTGGGSYCSGGLGVHIGLSGSQTGVNYSLYNGTLVTGPIGGTGGAINFGLIALAGTYTVSATGNTTGCTSPMRDSAVVTVLPVVVPSVGINVSPGDTVCSGTSTTFRPIPVNGGSSPVYQWRINGSPVSGGASYTFVPALGDQVKVTMTSDTACATPDTASDSLFMDVIAYRNPLVTVSAVPGDTVCKDYLVTLTTTTYFGGTSPVYTWVINGTIVATTGSTYSYMPANGDSINCILRSNYQCLIRDSSTSVPVKLNVIVPAIPSFYIAAYPGYHISLGQSDTLVAIVSTGAPNLTYQWMVGNSIITGATADTFIFTSSDSTVTDSVSCLISSAGFCTISTTNWTYITASDAGVKQVIPFGEIKVYPNPCTGVFTMQGSLAYNKVTIEVRDMTSRIVYSKDLVANHGVLNEQVELPGTLPAGAYILVMRTEEGKFNTWEIGVVR